MTEHHSHAVVWIDHHEARIFHFSATEVDRIAIHSNNPTQHIHHKANSIGSGKAPEDREFFKSVAETIADAKAVLITGPSNEKIVFANYIKESMPALAKSVVGVETSDHPTDGQIVAFARKYFLPADKMQPQIIK